ncbi:MAG: nickel/cobalt transporter [Xanthobacteraceae bacterium]|nr:nickel/cobalt transporter [Xanthobacteraceae bacterium]
MPLSRTTQARLFTALVLAAAAASMWLAAGHFDLASAQAANPFGGPRTPAAPPPSDGLFGWMFAKQAEFYRDMSRVIRSAKTDGSAVWTLLGIAFLYGIFHAAGPGHGKAVISSYVVANNETWWRGVVLSFASALLQAVVAVALVGIAAVVLNLTAGQICSVERVIEIASYALIALVGARLIWVKGRGFLNAARNMSRPLQPAGAAVTPHDHKHGQAQKHDHHGHDHHHHDHGHDHHDHHHDHAHGHDHGHHHGHDHHHHHDHGDEHASAWGHAHGPEPEQLAGPGGWQRGLSAIVAVGIRPCSGAIIVLVFALAQGLFWAGVAATFVMGLGTFITVALIATLAVAFRSAAQRVAGSRSGYGMLALRGIEVGAAVIVLAFGILLLVGYLAAERGACF